MRRAVGILIAVLLAGCLADDADDGPEAGAAAAADPDLLDLVVDVTPDFEAAHHVGTLEVPRFLVAGHPATIRFTTEAEDPSACRAAGDTPYIDGPGDVTYRPWTAVAGDACTFETVATFADPGTYSLRATDVVREETVQGIAVEVLPGHDAYFLPHPETT